MRIGLSRCFKMANRIANRCRQTMGFLGSLMCPYAVPITNGVYNRVELGLITLLE